MARFAVNASHGQLGILSFKERIWKLNVFQKTVHISILFSFEMENSSNETKSVFQSIRSRSHACV
jgi:hypothetical protein